MDFTVCPTSRWSVSSGICETHCRIYAPVCLAILFVLDAYSAVLAADGMTPLDRLLSNRVAADELRRLGGTERGPIRGTAVPDWSDEAFAYQGGVGETAN
jgi:hypothetical protein